MAKPEDMEELAAEFALGSLPPAERQEAEVLMASVPAFAEMVSAWERRLIPLALALEPVEAPPRIRGAVMKAIAGDAAGSERLSRGSAKPRPGALPRLGRAPLRHHWRHSLRWARPGGRSRTSAMWRCCRRKGRDRRFWLPLIWPAAASAC